jgi:TonB-dependent receptor
MVDRAYTNVLPGVHLRFQVNDGVVLRASWSNTLSRPSFGAISPRFTINNEDMEIDSGNPALKPYRSTGLDFVFDGYTGSSGVVSGGVFYKDIDDYIVSFTSSEDADFPGFEVTRPVNGTHASVLGFEFNLQQNLGHWSQPLDGVLIGGNVTLLDTNLELAERPDESFRLPLSSAKSGNVYLGYERGRFSGRLSVSSRSSYLNDVGDEPTFDVYVTRNTQVDLTASYRLDQAAEIFFEASNLADAPLSLYQGTPATTFQHEVYGRTFAMGLKGRF